MDTHPDVRNDQLAGIDRVKDSLQTVVCVRECRDLASA